MDKRVRTVAAISNTKGRSDMLLRRLDGCKLEQFKNSRHMGRFGPEVLVVRTDDALNRWASGLLALWTNGRPDG
jgi:hypothetical protein